MKYEHIFTLFVETVSNVGEGHIDYANSQSRLLYIVWANLCFSLFISLYIVQATSIWPYSHAKRFGRPLM
jgi:hypothetical protein